MNSIKHILHGGILIFLATLLACAPIQEPPPASTAQPGAATPPQVAAPPAQTPPAAAAIATDEAGQLPVRFQEPSYLVKDLASGESSATDTDIIIPVGADISSTTGPVPLRDILKQLVALKNMNVSWASDVDPSDMVDVDIRAEDDFFKSIDNLLRQKDYFHEVHGNTIVVKYKETRKFHIAMPFLTSQYTTSVGGDVLGSSGGSGNITGNIQLSSDANTFDIWANIRTNLDQVLEIWEEPMASSPTATAGATPATPAATGTTPAAAPATARNVKSGKGYYSIDKPIGLITVTAPRPLLEKIASYLDNLKKELYRQVSIEAKILEVTLDDTATRGIDWSGMLSGKGISFELFGSNGVIYEPGTSERMVSKLTLSGGPFSIAMDFLDTQGHTRVLANPRLSVMNGQPALISVGDSVSYIDSVTTTVSDSGVPSYAVSTGTVMSGLGMSVVATVMDNDEIVLSLTPVTSKLEEPITYLSFGGTNQVGLPKIKLREMNTTVRIKNGQILIIGGLMDTTDDNTGNSIPVLGDIPGLGKLFSHNTKTTQKTELVILLQPKII